MLQSSSCDAQNVERDARRRLTPSFPESSAHLMSLRHTPNAGFGVFATCSIPEKIQLLESAGPVVYVIYRAFRKEVCAWCFRYERGRNWKVRFGGEGGNRTGSSSGSGGLVFCCEECRCNWKEEHGERGVEAYAAVEGFAQRQARSKGWASEDTQEDDDKEPSNEDIEQAWEAVAEQASLIHAARSGISSEALSGNHITSVADLSNADSSPKPSKSQKHALTQSLNLPIPSIDTLFFLLSGVLCASSSHWSTLLTLNPSPSAVYMSMAALRQITSTFLHLTAVLPPSLLPYVTRATLEAVLSRDVGNSFGIWSTSVESQSKPESQQEDGEDPEMLGYGIWPVASFFNHSCKPNVARRRIGCRWVFLSASAISEGEELCISYIRGEEDVLRLDDRRKRLKDAWGFTCRCQKCFQEELNGRQDNDQTPINP